MTFEAAERVADAVLYEGYVLYPYRASAIKNKYRWQFGVIAPQSPHEDREPSFAQTECLIEAKSASPRVLIRVRFLRPQAVGREDQGSRAWLEGISHAIDFGPLDLNALSEERQFPLTAAALDARLTVVVRPITLSVRLLANMIAGHLLLTIFFLGTAYLLQPSITALFAVASFTLGVILVGFEMFVAGLQAYIFTILTAVYLAGALSHEH